VAVKDQADTRIAVSLSSDGRWLKVPRGRLPLRGDRLGKFTFHVDPAGVSRPGVHVATIRGRGPGMTGFAVPVAVVTPHPAVPEAGIPTVRLDGVQVDPADLLRVPFSLPPGTRTLAVSVEPADRAFADALALLFDGRGRRVGIGDGRVSDGRGEAIGAVLTGSDLPDGGSGELVLYGMPTAEAASRMDVALRFFALESTPLDRFFGAPGQAPSSRIEARNPMAVPFAGSVRGRLRGVSQSFDRTLPPSGLRHALHLSPEFAAVEVELELSDADWNRFTDIAVNVLDRDGKAVLRTGFTDPRLTVRVDSPGKGDHSYRLEVLGGRAESGGPDPKVRMTVRHLWTEPVELDGRVNGDKLVRVPPASTAGVEVRAERTPQAAPEGTRWFGELDFVARRDGAVWLRLPLLMGGR
jgi:hypothetical protein